MRNTSSNEILFLELVKVAFGDAVCLSHTPSADEWGELYAMAKKQSLVRRVLRWGTAATTATARASRK